MARHLLPVGRRHVRSHIPQSTGSGPFDDTISCRGATGKAAPLPARAATRASEDSNAPSRLVSWTPWSPSRTSSRGSAQTRRVACGSPRPDRLPVVITRQVLQRRDRREMATGVPKKARATRVDLGCRVGAGRRKRRGLPRRSTARYRIVNGRCPYCGNVAADMPVDNRSRCLAMARRLEGKVAFITGSARVRARARGSPRRGGRRHHRGRHLRADRHRRLSVGLLTTWPRP